MEDESMEVSHEEIFEKELNTYTASQLRLIILQLRAKPVDYLIQTFFKIKGINSSTFEKYQRRFNNIIFNNLEQVTRSLTLEVFLPKINRTVDEELSSVSHVSVLIHHSPGYWPQPVILQYFDRKTGIQNRLLDYKSEEALPLSILSQRNMFGKVSGFCGDFLYVDPGLENRHLETFSSIRLLTGKNVQYLPYKEGILKHLFTSVTDYLLVADLYKILTQLGEVSLLQVEDNSFGQMLQFEYETFLNGDNCDIFLSDFAGLVVDNLENVTTYLQRHQHLCKILQRLEEIHARFFLVYIREIYLQLDEMLGFQINSAVVYYFQLTKIQNLLKLYQETLFKTPKACKLFLHDLETLRLNAQEEVDFLRSFDAKIDAFYIRSLEIVAQIMENISHLDCFSWILLEDVNIDKFHRSHHIVNGIKDICDETCFALMLEVGQLDLANFSPGQNFYRLDRVWVNILNRNPDLVLVASLVEFALCLPVSFELLPIFYEKLKSGDVFQQAKNSVLFNCLDRVDAEEFVSGIAEFFSGQMGDVEGVLKRDQIQPLED